MIELPFKNICKQAVQALAEHLNRDDLKGICGQVELRAGQICLKPLSLITDKEMIILAVAQADENSALLGSGDFTVETSPIHMRLEDLFYLMTQMLLQGVRYRSPKTQQGLSGLQADMIQCGLPGCAGLLAGLERALNENDRAGQLECLSKLSLLAGRLQKESF